jgi:hypothetical protein
MEFHCKFLSRDLSVWISIFSKSIYIPGNAMDLCVQLFFGKPGLPEMSSTIMDLKKKLLKKEQLALDIMQTER